jgi:hypothetical protein
LCQASLSLSSVNFDFFPFCFPGNLKF